MTSPNNSNNSARQKITVEEDRPKDAGQATRTADNIVQLAKIDAESRKHAMEKESDLTKFKYGVLVITVSITLLLILHIFHVFFILRGGVDAIIPNELSSILTYIATTTLGFIFAEYKSKK